MSDTGEKVSLPKIDDFEFKQWMTETILSLVEDGMSRSADYVV